MRGGRDSRGRDVLDLGQGRGDFANGRQGTDTLAAERVRSCENVCRVEPRVMHMRGHGVRTSDSSAAWMSCPGRRSGGL